MTSLYEHERLQRLIEDAKRGGLLIRLGHDGRTHIIMDAAKWPSAAEGVIVDRAESLEDALSFVQGALWCREFLTMSGALKKS